MCFKPRDVAMKSMMVVSVPSLMLFCRDTAMAVSAGG